MPIYEYVCERCKNTFEQLVSNQDPVSCPGCNSSEVVKQFSTFGLGRSASGQYESLPLYKSGGGCGCNPSGCGCKN